MVRGFLLIFFTNTYNVYVVLTKTLQYQNQIGKRDI